MPAIVSKNPNTAGSGMILGTPYDSGGIVINAKSGVPPIKATDGTQQSATTLACDTTAGTPSNYLEGSNQNNEKSPATITNISLTSNVVTVTCANNFTVGQSVFMSGLTTATFLNNMSLVVASVAGAAPSRTGFTAAFTHANYGSAADTGTATYTNAARSAGLSLTPSN
jgi:hypothetical protein